MFTLRIVLLLIAGLFAFSKGLYAEEIATKADVNSILQS
jgi:hypothetical protein